MDFRKRPELADRVTGKTAFAPERLVVHGDQFRVTRHPGLDRTQYVTARRRQRGLKGERFRRQSWRQRDDHSFTACFPQRIGRLVLQLAGTTNAGHNVLIVPPDTRHRGARFQALTVNSRRERGDNGLHTTRQSV